MLDPNFDHIGVVVPELGPAMEQLSKTFNLEWLPTPGDGAVLLMRRPDREDNERIRIRAALSVQYPRIELIQAIPDTPWALSGTGFLLHHLAFYTNELSDDSKRLLGTCPMEIYGVNPDGPSPKTFTYQKQNGLLFELLEEQLLDDGQRQVNTGCVVEW